MATDLTDITKQGYLRYKSRSLSLWQKRWFVLRTSSNKGPSRLEKYADERAARNAEQHKLQLLAHVSAINRVSSKKHSFVIELHDGSFKCFACDSELEADNWVKLITQECFLPTTGISSGEPDVLKPGIQKELQEQFRVYLMPSSKLESFGECLLQVTHENIYLWDMTNAKTKLCAWPLTALRRYGSDLTKFTFEAGRHCATGEGMFIFHTLEGEKIYRKVHQATLAIAEAHQRMKKHNSVAATPPSLPKENSFQNCTNFPLTYAFNSSGLKTSPFDESPPNSGSLEMQQEQVSWYNSDNESDIAASASEVYGQQQNHESSRYALEQSQMLQAAIN